MADKNKKATSSYAVKKAQGVEGNHDRHPKGGIPWCELCQKEGRKFTPKKVLTLEELVRQNYSK